ncbi:hypothetical protein [Roseibium sp. TrichSKD4]|uniref:hypothetical protein n=1 Tax=Roseibium sp. TrichSKD4 TaxID=744980 RepID=UPI001AD8D0CA|nr:hypothetical protein [Roseibium sp. TrichSKD4]
MDEYFKLLRGKLSRFDDADLKAAADWFLETADTQTWPAIASAIKACETACARRLAADRPREVERGGVAPRMSVEWAISKIRADGGELLEGALTEGWYVGLIEFVQEHHCLPDSVERGELIDAARRVDQKLEAAKAEKAPSRMIALLVSGIEGKRQAIMGKVQAAMSA